MGFFSDLKDDLSQAVNELMPEEELEAVLGNKKEPEPETKAEEKQQAGIISSEDLSDMLDKVAAYSEEAEAQPDMPEEVSEPDAVPEPADAPEEAAVQEAEATWDVLPEEASVPEEPAASWTEAEIPVSYEAEEAAQTEIEPVMEMEPEEEPDIMEQPIEDMLLPEKKEEDKKMELQPKMMSDETAIVTEGMTIVGDVSSGGSLELIGSISGNIEVLGKLNVTGSIQGNSKAAEIYAEGARINGEINSGGSVKIGQSSVVIGNIFANSAVIAGAVKGDIDVQGPVVLDTSAIVMGNIKSKSVQINNGAVIEGMCSQCYAEVNPTTFFEEIKKKK